MTRQTHAPDMLANPVPTGVHFTIAFLTACAGGVVMLTITKSDPSFYGDGYSALVCAFMGAFLSGWVSARFFGCQGPGRWKFASLGAVVATLLGASLGGFFLGLYVIVSQGMFFEFDLLVLMTLGPVVVIPVMLLITPAGLVWLISMAMVHFISSRLRKDAGFLHSDD